MVRISLVVTAAALAIILAGMPSARAFGASPPGIMPLAARPAAVRLGHRTALRRHAGGPHRRHAVRGRYGIGLGYNWIGSGPSADSWPSAPGFLPTRREPSFATLPASTGIPRAPTPEPVIYRIEGTRERPVTRIIRIPGAEPRRGLRSRNVHAETGALLLAVPPR